MSSITTQVVDMTMKATPPIAVTGLTLFGYPLPDVVGVLTILYLSIHIGYILTKWIRGK